MDFVGLKKLLIFQNWIFLESFRDFSLANIFPKFYKILKLCSQSLSFSLFQNIHPCLYPESPVYYCQKGKEASARAAMQYLRGEQADIEEELFELHEGIEATANKVKDKGFSIFFMCASRQVIVV